MPPRWGVAIRRSARSATTTEVLSVWSGESVILKNSQVPTNFSDSQIGANHPSLATGRSARPNFYQLCNSRCTRFVYSLACAPCKRWTKEKKAFLTETRKFGGQTANPVPTRSPCTGIVPPHMILSPLCRTARWATTRKITPLSTKLHA